jgi:dTMP kinase
VSLFVTFEGPEGAGKSTQIAAVEPRLRARGIDVRVTREPGGTKVGERIRDILLGPADYVIVPATEALLLMAARSQHVADVVLPALSRGQVVLCDRYFDSTLAYQGAGRGLSVAGLQQIQEFAAGSLKPDVTILLDIPVEIGFRRRHESGEPLNRLDRDRREFHERVRSWYLSAAEKEPDRWMVFDARQDVNSLTEQIVECIYERLHVRTAAQHDRTSR